MTAARSQHGFTLLELIVVIGIFAVFAALAYGGLDSVLRARVGLDRAAARVADFQRAYLLLRRDFQNAAYRPIRDENGEVQPAFRADAYTGGVEFTRGGWQNLLALPRPTLERVRYRLDDREGEQAQPLSFDQDRRLVRESWPMLDRAPRSKPTELTLLDHVSEWHLRYLDARGGWHETWPDVQATGGDPAAQLGPPPRAIEIRLTSRDWGELRFVFATGAENADQILRATTLAPAPAPATPATTPQAAR